MSDDLRLVDLTPEDVCRKLMPISWGSATPKDRERWIGEAKRYLDAIKSMCASVDGKEPTK